MNSAASPPMQPMSSAQVQRALDETPFIQWMGIRVKEWQPAEQQLVLTMPFRTEIGGGADEGHVHGGAIGAVIDTAASMVFYALGVQSAPTVDYRIDLLRPVVRSGMHARAVVRKLGKTVGIADVEVRDDAGKLVALGRANMAIR
jgi:uncharacterized protein (TIGR00369 family)